MTAQEILSDFRRRKVALFVKAGRLSFRGPKGAVTPELRRAVDERREELLTLLRSAPAVDAADAVLAECERILDAFLNGSGPTPAQRSVAEELRRLTRHYAEVGDAELWEMPATLRQQIGWWQPRR